MRFINLNNVANIHNIRPLCKCFLKNVNFFCFDAFTLKIIVPLSLFFEAMMKLLCYFQFMGLLLTSVSCHFSEKEQFSGNDISVTWEMKSNFAVDGKTCMMEFTLTNHGKKTLGSGNWTLYFTQMNSPVIPNNDHPVASVEHINGYFYRLVPNKNFHLKPGTTQNVIYYFEYPLGRESDAPCGLYFVFYENTSVLHKIKILSVKLFPVAI